MSIHQSADQLFSQSPPEPTEFQQLAAATALQNMFSGRHFDISAVMSVAGALRLQRGLTGLDYDALRALHCVEWGAMAPGLPAMVREKCLELLAMPPRKTKGRGLRAKTRPEEKSHLSSF